MIEAAKKIEINSATLEALKWLAVILMTIDHTNTFVLQSAHTWMYDAGRIAFPLFGFAFAYNMTRPSFFERFPSRLLKIVVIGLIAQIPMVLMHVSTFHLNIMFTLGFTALIIYAVKDMPRVAIWGAILCSLILLNDLVDYGSLGVLYVLAAYNLARRPGYLQWTLFIFALALLYYVNGNFYTLAALPIVLAAQKVRVPCPRTKQAFYAYYPTHLAVLAGLSLTVFRT